jgi:hypothetical protein
MNHELKEAIKLAEKRTRHADDDEVTVRAEQQFWRAVAAALGWTVIGWTCYEGASFRSPTGTRELDGDIAAKLLSLHAAEQDTRRLDWLDNKNRDAHQNDDYWAIWLDTSNPNSDPVKTTGNLREAIDNAMSAKGPHE